VFLWATKTAPRSLNGLRPRYGRSGCGCYDVLDRRLGDLTDLRDIGRRGRPPLATGSVAITPSGVTTNIAWWP